MEQLAHKLKADFTELRRCFFNPLRSCSVADSLLEFNDSFIWLLHLFRQIVIYRKWSSVIIVVVVIFCATFLWKRKKKMRHLGYNLCFKKYSRRCCFFAPQVFLQWGGSCITDASQCVSHTRWETCSLYLFGGCFLTCGVPPTSALWISYGSSTDTSGFWCNARLPFRDWLMRKCNDIKQPFQKQSLFNLNSRNKA